MVTESNCIPIPTNSKPKDQNVANVRTRRKSNKVKQLDVKLSEKNKLIHKRKRKTKLKQYTSECLTTALQAVQQGENLKEVSIRFGIPYATIFRLLKNPEKLNARSGPPTVLSKSQEQEIIDWIQYRAERGFPINRVQLLESVQTYIISQKIKNPFKHNKPGRNWYYFFTKRHPDLPIKKAKIQDSNTSLMLKEDLNDWFQKTEMYLEKKSLLFIKNDSIFHCDEIRMGCDDGCNVTLEKFHFTQSLHANSKRKSIIDKECFTTMFMFNGNGTRAPPMILYKCNECPSEKMIANVPKDWGIRTSKNGLMTEETFFEYLTKVFYPWLLKNDTLFPIIIYLHSHTVFVTISLVSFCREKNIELIPLFPNEPIIQPLENTFFKPLKKAWKEMLVEQTFKKNTVELKDTFPLILKKVLKSIENTKNIVNGFKAAGLAPFNANIINIMHSKDSNPIFTVKQEVVSEEDMIINNMSEEMQHLKIFEMNLSKELLNQFKHYELAEVWAGDVENKGLFDYWLKIKKAADSSCTDLTITETILYTDQLDEIYQDHSFYTDDPLKTEDS